MISRTRGLATLALLLTLPVAACDDGMMGAQQGTLTLMLTDAPGDVAHAYVTIDRIYLQPGEDQNGAERVDLMTDDVTVDLLTLTDDNEDGVSPMEELVADAPVPTGFYQQLRVVVAEACIAVESEVEGRFDVYTTDDAFDACAVEDGVAGNIAFSGALQAPSMSRSGIKVIMPGEGLEVVGGQQVLLLDFDVEESFGHVAGRSGRWVMHPVIKGGEIGLTSAVVVSVRAAEDLEMPTIDGTVMTLGDLEADLSTEEIDATLSDDDGDGTFTGRFSLLVPDASVVPVVSIEGEGVDVTTDPASVEVTLSSGAEVQVDFVVTGVTEVAESGG